MRIEDLTPDQERIGRGLQMRSYINGYNQKKQAVEEGRFSILINDPRSIQVSGSIYELTQANKNKIRDMLINELDIQIENIEREFEAL